MHYAEVKKADPRSGRLLILIAILAGVVGLAVFASYLLWFGDPIDSQEIAGQFGDFLGGALNPWFSFLALVALLYTIHLQSHELRLTREQFVRSSDALEAQNTALQVQNFESTYFNLLKLYHDLVDRAHIDQESRTCRGRECFQVLVEEWRSEGLHRVVRGDQVDPLQGVRDEYSAFFDKHKQHIGHCFRTLYNVIAMLEERDIGDTKIYFNLLRAQLSQHELELLFYNSISDIGAGLGRKAKKYGLLSGAALGEDAEALFGDRLLEMQGTRG